MDKLDQAFYTLLIWVLTSVIAGTIVCAINPGIRIDICVIYASIVLLIPAILIGVSMKDDY